MAPGRREAKWNDLDRQWKRAEPWHELGRIGDDDHALRGRGDDLLAQQRPAAALDQTELGIDFVGPVDRQVELRNVVKCSERNAKRLRLRGRRLGGRDTADVEPCFDLFAHEIDELARGRAAAEPELHARSDQLKRPFGRLPLSLVPVWRRGHALNCFRSLNAAARSRADNRGTSGESRFTGWRERRQIPLPLTAPLYLRGRVEHVLERPQAGGGRADEHRHVAWLMLVLPHLGV